MIPHRAGFFRDSSGELFSSWAEGEGKMTAGFSRVFTLEVDRRPTSLKRAAPGKPTRSTKSWLRSAQQQQRSCADCCRLSETNKDDAGDKQGRARQPR